MVEFAPSETVGELVELMEVVTAPENPAAFAVLKYPLIVAVPDVPKVITLLPASIVADEATVSDLELFKAMLKLPVLNNPLLALIFPVTFAVVIAAPNVAPVTASVLFVVICAYVKFVNETV